MRLGGGVAIVPVALAVVFALFTAPTADPATRPLRAALLSSVLLFAAGGAIGIFINGSNVRIPAHYHGCIVGVTLALMGLVYRMLPALGYRAPQGRLATSQPWLYAAGQLMHIAGLVWSGGYGVQRKVAGAEQVLRSTGRNRRHGPDGPGRRDRHRRRPAVRRGRAARDARPRHCARRPAGRAVMKRLQSLLQWLFLRLEALFNAAFGDKLNPLYHLGAMSFFLFWVVAGSGLYLYAFFETGVAQAYSSVEALTHGQWFAGGILRSVHRYASDAMVVTMLVHLLRHFAFDRFHGFRWFSWATGVALIWGVYISGINGYMLPWDRLAQFVIVASFEWLDWLPSFGGTLMRNFIHPTSVGDRFFSLLSFMHIGLPLVVLLLMWVHVQRVPKARTTPPRPIVVSLLATLAALSLARPVLSQGGAADLGTAATTLQLDWFYLPLFPLIDRWPLGQVWALAMGGTALLVLLPWWPPKFHRGARRERQVVVHGAAGAAHAVAICARAKHAGRPACARGSRCPYECRNGGCGVCLCSIEHGSVEHRPYQLSALPDAVEGPGQGADVLRRTRRATW